MRTKSERLLKILVFQASVVIGKSVEPRRRSVNLNRRAERYPRPVSLNWCFAPDRIVFRAAMSVDVAPTNDRRFRQRFSTYGPAPLISYLNGRLETAIPRERGLVI